MKDMFMRSQLSIVAVTIMDKAYYMSFFKK